jgi:hypothetical protein
MSIRKRLGQNKPGAQSVPTKSVIEKTQEQLVFEKYFKENELLLKSIRSLMLGLPVSDEQKETVRSTFSDEILYGYIRRRFYPTYKDESAQIGGLMDVYLGVEQMCFNQEPHAIEQAINYKNISLELTRKGLKLLLDPNSKENQIDLDDYLKSPEEDPLQVHLLGRNIYMRHIDKQLSILYVVANAERMTQAEVAKRLQLDSAQ